MAKPATTPAARLEAVDAVFAALAHASRRHILLVLHYRGGAMTARGDRRAFRVQLANDDSAQVAGSWISTFAPRNSGR